MHRDNFLSRTAGLTPSAPSVAWTMNRSRREFEVEVVCEIVPAITVEHVERGNMYLFTRQARLLGLQAAPWAVSIGAAAAKATGGEVRVWTRTLSPGYGTVVWSSFWEDLASREASFEALATDTNYLSLAAEGAPYLVGGIDDTLYNVAYEGAHPGGDNRFVSIVQSACANGSVVRGMTTGVEIAKRAEAISGHSTAFVANATGQWGGVGWIAGYQSIAEYEAAQVKLGSDASWLEFLDGSTQCYSQETGATQSLVLARLG